MRYFNRGEFVCPCCGLEYMDDVFLNILDKIRAACGFPFLINSGWRCDKHNKDIGGAIESAHLRGLAADIKCLDSKRRAIIDEIAVKHGIRRRGLARSFIHLDIDTFLPAPRMWFY